MSVEAVTRNIGSKTSGATTLGLTHTVDAGLTNSALLAYNTTGSSSAVSITAVAWDSAGVNEALGRRGVESGPGNDSNVRGSTWYKVSPTAGASKNILATAASSCEITLHAATYQYVNQVTPWRNVAPTITDGTPTAGTPQPNATTVSAVGDRAVGVFFVNENSTDDTLTAGSGMTLIGQQNIGAGKHSGGSVDAPGAASVVVSMPGVSDTNHWGGWADSLMWDGSGGGSGPPIDDDVFLPYMKPAIPEPSTWVFS